MHGHVAWLRAAERRLLDEQLRVDGEVVDLVVVLGRSVDFGAGARVHVDRRAGVVVDWRGEARFRGAGGVEVGLDSGGRESRGDGDGEEEGCCKGEELG